MVGLSDNSCRPMASRVCYALLDGAIFSYFELFNPNFKGKRCRPWTFQKR